MRTADHYARTPELAALNPADRIPWQESHWTADADRFTCLTSGIGGSPLPVEANHGRWLVNCPCGGAQLTHPNDRRFMCVECGNKDNNYQWREVVWPDDWREIETALHQRNRPWMNYAPGETAEGLEAEHALLKELGGLKGFEAKDTVTGVGIRAILEGKEGVIL